MVVSIRRGVDRQVGLVLILALLLLTLSGSASEPVVRYEDGCEMPPGFEPFDVRSVEIYRGPGHNYTLVVQMCESQTKYAYEDEGVVLPIIGILIDRDSDERTGGKLPSPTPSWLLPSLQGYESAILAFLGGRATLWQWVGYEWKEWKKWSVRSNLSDRYEITLPGFIIKPGVSRLVYLMASPFYDKPYYTPRFKLGDLFSGEWVELVRDEYDGLPIDVKSVDVRLDWPDLLMRWTWYTRIPKNLTIGLLFTYTIGDAYIEAGVLLPHKEVYCYAYDGTVYLYGRVYGKPLSFELANDSITLRLDLTAPIRIDLSSISLKPSPQTEILIGYAYGIPELVPNKGWITFKH